MAYRNLLRIDSANYARKSTFKSNPTGSPRSSDPRPTRFCATAEPEPHSEEKALLSVNRPLKLVLLSDDDAFCSLLKAYLQHLGFSILTCTNSDRAEALFLTRDDIDLWLIDTQALGMEGAYFAVKVRQFHPGIPIVLLAGSAGNQNMLQQFFWEGWIRVEKCIELPRLLAIIQLAVAESSPANDQPPSAGSSPDRLEDDWKRERAPDWDLWRNRN